MQLHDILLLRTAAILPEAISQFAGYGVAMGNATEHLKSIADYVTKSNDEDGVAYAIENILLN